MSKAVLISIRPKWCDLIASGKKTIEVRKTAPKLSTPFKCYIYQTLPKSGDWNERDGRVIGEFICDAIEKHWLNSAGCRDLSEPSYVPANELHIYAQPQEWLFGWHISNLVIYDKPKELSEFWKLPCERVSDCGACKMFDRTNFACMRPPLLTRPPQSWCYVEELT